MAYDPYAYLDEKDAMSGCCGASAIGRTCDECPSLVPEAAPKFSVGQRVRVTEDEACHAGVKEGDEGVVNSRGPIRLRGAYGRRRDMVPQRRCPRGR